MKSPLQIIADMGCPITSQLEAIRFFSERNDLSEDEYIDGIQQIIGTNTPPKVSSYYYARVLFLYVIQEIVRANQNSIIPDIDELYAMCIKKSHTYIEDNPWTATRFNISHGLVDHEEIDPETGEPIVSKRKGDKKEITERIFLDLKEKGVSRPEIIEAFIAETEMSKAGATTYFHMLKKQHGFVETKNDSKKPKPESKQQIADRIYQESVDKSKAVMIPLLEQHLGTSKLGAQTYYYACKKKFTTVDSSANSM